MDIEQFRKSPSGRLVRSGTGREAYWSFVPNPLPPELEYDQSLAALLADASAALGRLAGLGRTLVNPHILVRPFLRREAVASSRIEGTLSDVADLYAYEAGQRRAASDGASEADVREVLNYVHALEYGLARLSDLPVSLRLLREIHARLLAGVRGSQAAPGRFRRVPNWIGGASPAEATYVPPPVPEMQECLRALERYLHEEPSDPELIRLALIHYQFEAIHPFVDGNGRIGRLMISLLIVHWGLLPLPLLYLSPFFERYRQEYYDLLLEVSTTGAWDNWVRFFLRGVSEECEDATRRAGRLQDLRDTWRHQFERTRSSARLLRLIDSLFERPILTVRDAATTLDVTYRPAQKNVDKLVEAGILYEVPDTSNPRLFVAQDILGIAGATDSGG
jgi:Fic family protein